KIKTALERLDALLAEDPKNAKARFLKGLALAEDEQYGEAIEILLNLTIDYPKAPQIYNNLGIIYTRVERYDDAIDMFKKAFRVDPEYAEAYENLGDIYVSMAGVAYIGALAIDTKNPAVHEKLASLKKFPAIVDRHAAVTKRAVTPKPRATTTESRTPASKRPRSTGWSLSSDEVSSPASNIAEETRTSIEQTLRAWASAWSRGDVDAYLKFYDDEFAPAGGMKYERWKQQRRERLTAAQSISVKLENIAIEPQGADGAYATFRQHYRSANYRDRVDKRLILKRRNGEWRIVREVTLSS
ncbi:MAG: tetratricopeptide repeat protein, partial [Gammaproteobacteria bacterium]|nr:tetratricopeptide repeat protein [Gammaproteobacteria bacterium]